MQPQDTLDVRPAVTSALAAHRPVVALVTSPLSNTIPWPTNIEAVRMATDAVSREGGLLAVVGVWKGKLTVGLEAGEIEALARDRNAKRASRRDLPTAVLRGWTAGTTVSASIYIAWKAGIKLVATGAIGTARSLIHDSSHSWDISSDLVELSCTPVAVVSSGARNTSRPSYAAEVLDTFRVPLVGYRTDSFPTFYMGVGSSPVSARVDTPADAARFLKLHWSMNGEGVVLAQPTPPDVALSPDELIPAVLSIENQAVRDGITRQSFSPFMMDRLNLLTRGKAHRAYLGILVANARLAVEVAKDLEDK